MHTLVVLRDLVPVHPIVPPEALINGAIAPHLDAEAMACLSLHVPLPFVVRFVLKLAQRTCFDLATDERPLSAVVLGLSLEDLSHIAVHELHDISGPCVVLILIKLHRFVAFGTVKEAERLSLHTWPCLISTAGLL